MENNDEDNKGLVNLITGVILNIGSFAFGTAFGAVTGSISNLIFDTQKYSVPDKLLLSVGITSIVNIFYILYDRNNPDVLKDTLTFAPGLVAGAYVGLGIVGLL
jgi:hypothetical protein